jgi:hypothetical protein
MMIWEKKSNLQEVHSELCLDSTSHLNEGMVRFTTEKLDPHNVSIERK